MFIYSSLVISIPCVIISCLPIAAKLISSCSIRANAEELLFLSKLSVEGEEKATNTAPLRGSCCGLDLQNVLQSAFRGPSVSGCNDSVITSNGLFEAAVLIN